MSKWPVSKRVEVEWIDTATYGRWNPVEHHVENSTPILCRSIGYLLKADKHVVIIAQSQSEGSEHVADTIAIPRDNVKRMVAVTSKLK